MNRTFSTATIIFLALLYVVFIVIFGVLIRHSIENVSSLSNEEVFVIENGTRKSAKPAQMFGLSGSSTNTYSLFQNVHVMVFIGFGFLLTYLKKYGRSSLVFSLLIGCFVIFWYLIVDGLIYMIDISIVLTQFSLIKADLAAAAFLISLGVVLGKFNILQLYLMAILETPVYAANKYLIEDVLVASDIGGSVSIHTFGAFFGLGISLVHGLRGGPIEYKTDLEKSSYQSDIFTMLGTLFLWLFWPSFNAALAVGIAQYRAIMNTYIALLSSCVAVAVFTIAVSKDTEWKLNMFYIQHATLAAGVAVGSCAPLKIFGWQAMLLGLAGGGLSVAGYRFIQEIMAKKLRMHDTYGVFSLHGLPGIIGGLAGCVMLYIATYENYGFELYLIYPAMSSRYKARSRTIQALFQLCSLVCSMSIGFAGGLITGALVVLAIPNLTEEERYIDEVHWDYSENE